MSDGKKLLVYVGYMVVAILWLVFLGGYLKVSLDVIRVWWMILIVGIGTALPFWLFPGGKSDDSSDDD